MKNLPSQYNSQAGFTLVELMVSLTLFVIVVLALISSLYGVNNASRKVQAMRTVMDNLNFAMESMSRNIRTSDTIVCGGEDGYGRGDHNCRLGQNETPQNLSISVRSTLGAYRLVEYRWNDHEFSIEKKDRKINADGTLGPDLTGWTAITAPQIKVEKAYFYVNGANTPANSGNPLYDKDHPSVILKIEGVADGANGTQIPFAIQTFLSQRGLE